MKTVKILFFSVVFTLTFCFAAFASEKKIPATENFTNDVVYDNPRNLENADANKSVQTGDRTNVLLWVMLLGVSSVGLLCGLYRKKR